MPGLERLIAREVLDSRGNPTVEVEAVSDTGHRGLAIVPSGASTGRHEALELRDGDPARYRGKGVRKAVANVEREIGPAIEGLDLDEQGTIDRVMIELDGTADMSRLGANAILGVSMAVAYAAAAARGEPLYVHLHRLWRNRLEPEDAPDAGPVLPLPMVNLISGGLHAGRQVEIQDVLMMAVGARSYAESLEMTVAVYRCLGEVLRAHGEEWALVGDEGGYGPRLGSSREAFDRVLEAFSAAGLEPDRDVAIALDVAATHFFDPATGRYHFRSEGGLELEPQQMVQRLEDWAREVPALISIEDGLAEDDWAGWTALTEKLGRRMQLVGDDLFCTQVARIRQGIDLKAANAVLVKVNQVGTLSKTFDALLLARRHGYHAVVSARSGETEDATIADLAVATAAGQIKIGSVARSERLAKYNRLLRIEERLGGHRAPFAGRAALLG